MNRRDFLKTLAAIPALAWLKPEVVDPVKTIDLGDMPDAQVAKLKAKWKEKVDTGEAWKVVSADSQGNLYYSNWVTPESYDKLAVWNGSTWKEVQDYTE
jgi:hypothetical protein